jgi:phage-related protein
MPSQFSFTFGGVDMLAEFGIRIETSRDVLTPQLRARKVEVPGRDGAFDYGAKFYDERIVGFDCVSISNLTRAQMYDLAYVLSSKAKIVTYKDPTKYYIGRLYDSAVIEYIGRVGSKYPLDFICDPFAYGDQVTEVFDNAKPVTYAGTARTPTLITITNTNDYPINGLTITMQEAIL